MAIHNPKFENHIKSRISQADSERVKSRYGIVTGYDRTSNTATVLMTASDSDLPSEVLKNVPCPVLLGVQTVAPEPGRPCWVVFKGNSETFPVISHFFNHSYEKFDYKRQNNASTGIPSFVSLL